MSFFLFFFCFVVFVFICFVSFVSFCSLRFALFGFFVSSSCFGFLFLRSRLFVCFFVFLKYFSLSPSPPSPLSVLDRLVFLTFGRAYGGKEKKEKKYCRNLCRAEFFSSCHGDATMVDFNFGVGVGVGVRVGVVVCRYSLMLPV